MFMCVGRFYRIFQSADGTWGCSVMAEVGVLRYCVVGAPSCCVRMTDWLA